MKWASIYNYKLLYQSKLFLTTSNLWHIIIGLLMSNLSNSETFKILTQESENFGLTTLFK